MPDIQPPSAMPNIVHMMTAPTRVPASPAAKCSRTMIAYDGTIPPWKRPNSAEITYSDTKPSNGRNSSSAMPCSIDPRTSVRNPPIRSQMAPEMRRLAIPKPSMIDNISAPRAAP